jgi:CRP-like cAMP-binding protein
MLVSLPPHIQHLESFIPFTAAEREMLVTPFVARHFRKRQMLLNEGEICRHYSFIVSGCVRMYALDDKGNEHNIQFGAENDWITDFASFHTRKPSLLHIQAIEETSMLQIEQPDLYRLYINIPKLDRIFKVITENKYVELQNRVLQNLSATAEARYLNFLETYPTLSARLPNTQIASYLGITPEFLSKIRNDIAKKRL